MIKEVLEEHSADVRSASFRVADVSLDQKRRVNNLQKKKAIRHRRV